MDTLVSLCKRRGFIFQSSEIYGGTGSCWDYGPLGVELKNNIKRVWWRDHVQTRADMVGLDASILMHATVWKASGHVDHFTDPMVDCRECRRRFRADTLNDTPWVHYCDATKGNKFTIPGGGPCTHCGLQRTLCPDCGKGELTPPRQFNLMFKTFMGPVAEDAAVTYLRPETAQGIFVNFDNVLQSMRRKLPFGIAQIGKAFRNEITPGNFIFRTREFEQMEIEYFVNPHDSVGGRPADEYWHERWIEDCMGWFQRYGLQAGNLRLREHEKDELAHYAKRTADIEYRFPLGWSELMGIANRTDFDLKQHAKWSGKTLTYFDEERKEHVVPYVIEPSAGVDRALLAFLADAYREEEVRGEKRVVLRLHPELAPIKIAVLPLLKKREEIVRTCQAIREELARLWPATYDDTAAIGRLYRRQDEVGTPFCVTVDVQTAGDSDRGEAGDGRVTIRDRDSMQQVRVPIGGLTAVFGELLGGETWNVVAGRFGVVASMDGG
ncbi:MAG: glycine--tRNA ligase [Candidatus Rokubacteria bacterium]|nr:glycine--tRNA ligase [Candidatus Rokubacteria bacterium]MBI3104863.1 glycine--tRNA ligase [Candidatus Rokubacteria bacterium]